MICPESNECSVWIGNILITCVVGWSHWSTKQRTKKVNHRMDMDWICAVCQPYYEDLFKQGIPEIWGNTKQDPPWSQRMHLAAAVGLDTTPMVVGPTSVVDSLGELLGIYVWLPIHLPALRACKGSFFGINIYNTWHTWAACVKRDTTWYIMICPV